MKKRDLRIRSVEIVIIILFGSIFLRLSELHLNPKDFVSVKKIEDIRSYEKKSIGKRGQIIDRNNELMATDVTGYNLFIDPYYISKEGDAELVSSSLSDAIPVFNKNDLLEKLSNTKRKYVPLLRKISVNYPGISKFKKHKFLPATIYYPDNQDPIILKGVVLENINIRSYPKRLLMSHVLGFVNAEGIGSGGIEQKYNAYLKGKKGYRKTKRDAKGYEIYNAREIDDPPENGATITLTIDQYIQQKAEEQIYNICAKYKAKAAWAIVQHIPTGEILAMASYPTFDPNKYNKSPAEWRRNRVISMNYDPGSTLKAALIALAIDHKIVNPDDEYWCENGKWYHAGRYLNDHDPYGNLSVSDILKVSSNIGSAKIALKLGDEKLFDGFRLFNFGEKLNIELPGEENGQLNPLQNWTKISSSRIGIGQGITTTGIQVLSMMSTIANDGKQMQPRIVKNIISSDGEILLENQPKIIGNPISKETARTLQKMLINVVEDDEGTGGKARVKGYLVGGKTGTAQKAIPHSEGGGYYDKRFISSFVGFIPANNPQIAILVTADDPGITTSSGQKIKYYGGTVCGPAFKEIAEETVNYLRIPPEGKKIYITRD